MGFFPRYGEQHEFWNGPKIWDFGSLFSTSVPVGGVKAIAAI